MNEAIFEAINGLVGRSSAIDAVARFGAGPAPYLLLALVAGLGIVDLRAHWRPSLGFALWSAAGIGAALILSKLLGSWLYEDRPFLGEPGVKLLISHGADSSFPSLHATLAASVATAASFRWPRWTPVFLGFVLLVGISRVLVGVHYPDDVVAGWAIGAGVAGAASTLRRGQCGRLVASIRP